MYYLALDPPRYKIEEEQPASADSDYSEIFKKILKTPAMMLKVITIIYRNPANMRRCGFRRFRDLEAEKIYPDPFFRKARHWDELQTSLENLEEELVADGVLEERIPKFQSNQEINGGDPMMEVPWKLGT